MEIPRLYNQAVRAKTREAFQAAIDAIPPINRFRVLHLMASVHCHPDHPTAKSRRILARLEKEYTAAIWNQIWYN